MNYFNEVKRIEALDLDATKTFLLHTLAAYEQFRLEGGTYESFKKEIIEGDFR